jgi:protein-L-isoaspartate(D-aspartate) O-methyltransferase
VTDLTARRRFFAEEIQMTAALRSASLVEALASVPRERFLPPGPWTVRGESDFRAPIRQTPDGNPRHVYHNIAIGIHPERMLFNGAPGLLAMAIDALGLETGSRVLHVGAGTGYYTALMAHCVGPTGRVVAVEVDEELAARARTALAEMPWIDVRHGNGLGLSSESFDGILVNAGVTHPQEAWLDDLARNGRLIVPLTATGPGMGPIGKGLLLLLTRTADSQALDARLLGFVAIYSAIGLRDDGMNADLGNALTKQMLPPLKRLRRDRHDPSASCWLHGTTWCLSV